MGFVLWTWKKWRRNPGIQISRWKQTILEQTVIFFHFSKRKSINWKGQWTFECIFCFRLSQLHANPCLAVLTLNLLVTFLCIPDLIWMPHSMQIIVLHPPGHNAFESGYRGKISYLKLYLKGFSITAETFSFITCIAAAPRMCYMLYPKMWSGVRAVWLGD